MKKKLYTKEDIEKAINFLKTNHPEKPATEEEAIKILDGMQTFAESFVDVAKKKSKKTSN